MTAIAELEVPRGTDAPADRRIHLLPLDVVTIGPNVRVNVTAIEELAASIAEQGVLQPIKVRHAADGAGYIVVWGQRRRLAAEMAGLIEIPAIIDDTARTEAELALEQLAENLSREDLNPIDRARAMKAVVDAGLTQAELARKLGIGASTVSNDIRLLEASPAVHEALAKGSITASHAKTLLPLPAKEQAYFVNRIASGGLPAHRLEEEVGWKLQTIRGEEAAAERSEKQAPKLVAALAAAGVEKTTKVRLSTPYNMKAPPLEAALKKAGYELLPPATYAWPRGDAAKCDCAIVRVEFNRSWKVEPGCLDERHRDRQRNVDLAGEEKRRKAIRAKTARLESAICIALERSVPAEIVRLIATRNYHDLAARWEGEIGMVRLAASQSLAAVVNSEYAYGEFQAQADANLDEALAALEALAGITVEPEKPAAAQAPKEPAFGQPVRTLPGPGEPDYRILQVVPEGIYLALNVRNWRNGAASAITQRDVLTWDDAAKYWRGRVAPLQRAETPA